jgi:hypothetical protein
VKADKDLVVGVEEENPDTLEIEPVLVEEDKKGSRTFGGQESRKYSGVELFSTFYSSKVSSRKCSPAYSKPMSVGVSSE